MHQLRQFFGTHTYRSSHDLLLVGDLMGHSNPSTTAIYSRFDRAGAREAVEALSVKPAVAP
jgi:site-specific recombinase XerC